VSSSSWKPTGVAFHAALGKVSVTFSTVRQLLAVHVGLPLIGTAMEVLEVAPALVRVAVTVTVPDTGSCTEGMLMSGLPAEHTRDKANRQQSQSNCSRATELSCGDW
jgi:hypothetical protein